MNDGWLLSMHVLDSLAHLVEYTQHLLPNETEDHSEELTEYVLMYVLDSLAHLVENTQHLLPGEMEDHGEVV